jgi:hypothetical protein
VLKVRSGQLSALAHNFIVELLPLVQVAHSGALDCGNMHEDVLPTIGRLNEAETLLGIEKLDCTLSHVRPSFATPIGVHALRDIAQPCVRIQRSLERSPGGQITRAGKISNTRLYRLSRQEINHPIKRQLMAFKPNYGRDRAERARAARARSEEKQRKKDEKAALRKAERDAAEPPPDDKQG